ncbi:MULTISPECIES: YidB family protein [Acetobacter]|uniref:YidB family protein n=1 Tax=Acetobacter TaxID=434 RepID=UPI000A381D22|nr:MULTISPECIES: YidB family protein [Acetobacter]MBS0960021.1 DUF937 domain-containing protein [Acetobacter thailandicus]MBS0979350.1 DUF937 domain-containing protein [Acetobacter thailandicus]MBS0985554.1 DUF937 domain-containing protein [Acetobacter thailandicus]MBS1002469.1 DUF937 domain-containing protein [Acetobacter thailandicus]OUI88600.1 hypothetical protein HK11_05535 [Acetobacter sp. DmW_043]
MSGFLANLVNKVESTIGSSLSGVMQQQLQSFLQPEMIAKIQAKADECGLGDKVRSWIGQGDNLPVTADEIREMLGSETLHNLVDRSGLPADAVLGALAQFLPEAVHKATPDGTIADKSESSSV